MALLKQEADEAKDVLILQDSAYQGLPGSKMLEFYEWVRLHRPAVDYVVKADQVRPDGLGACREAKLGRKRRQVPI